MRLQRFQLEQNYAARNPSVIVDDYDSITRSSHNVNKNMERIKVDNCNPESTTFLPLNSNKSLPPLSRQRSQKLTVLHEAEANLTTSSTKFMPFNNINPQERCQYQPNPITLRDSWNFGSLGNDFENSLQPWKLTLQDPSLTPTPKTTRNCNDNKKLPQGKQKSKTIKWTILDGIFRGRRRVSGTSATYYDNDVWSQFPGQPKTTKTILFKNQKSKEKNRIKPMRARIENYAVKPVLKTRFSKNIRSSSMLLEESFLNRSSIMNKFLDVDIPSTELDRYSVMFSGVIYRKPSVRRNGTRRAPNLENFYTAKERLILKEKEYDEKFRRQRLISSLPRSEISSNPTSRTNQRSSISKGNPINGETRNYNLSPRNLASVFNKFSRDNSVPKIATDELFSGTTNSNMYHNNFKAVNNSNEAQQTSKKLRATQKPLPPNNSMGTQKPSPPTHLMGTQKPLPLLKEEKEPTNYLPPSYLQEEFYGQQKPLPCPYNNSDLLGSTSNLFPDDENEKFSWLVREELSKLSDNSSGHKHLSHRHLSCSSSSSSSYLFSISMPISGMGSPRESTCTTSYLRESDLLSSQTRSSSQNLCPIVHAVTSPHENSSSASNKSTTKSNKSHITNVARSEFDTFDSLNLQSRQKLDERSSSENKSPPSGVCSINFTHPTGILPSSISPLDAFTRALNEELERVAIPIPKEPKSNHIKEDPGLSLEHKYDFTLCDETIGTALEKNWYPEHYKEAFHDFTDLRIINDQGIVNNNTHTKQLVVESIDTDYKRCQSLIAEQINT